MGQPYPPPNAYAQPPSQEILKKGQNIAKSAANLAFIYGAWFLSGVIYKITDLSFPWLSKAGVELAVDLVMAVLPILAGSLLLAQKPAGRVLAIISGAVGLLVLVPVELFLGMQIGGLSLYYLSIPIAFVVPITLIVLPLIPAMSLWLDSRVPLFAYGFPQYPGYPQQPGYPQPQTQPQQYGYSQPQYQNHPPQGYPQQQQPGHPLQQQGWGPPRQRPPGL